MTPAMSRQLLTAPHKVACAAGTGVLPRPRQNGPAPPTINLVSDEEEAPMIKPAARKKTKNKGKVANETSRVLKRTTSQVRHIYVVVVSTHLQSVPGSNHRRHT